ncbi:MAG: cadherin-like domain-containing protein [Pirellulaceae bacterium]
MIEVAVPGVLGNDVDVDSANLSVQLVTSVSNGVDAKPGSGSFRYVPEVDFVGTDVFTYRTSDGTTQSDLVEVSLFVGSSPVRISEIMAANVDALTTRVRASANSSFPRCSRIARLD